MEWTGCPHILVASTPAWVGSVFLCGPGRRMAAAEAGRAGVWINVSALPRSSPEVLPTTRPVARQSHARGGSPH